MAGIGSEVSTATEPEPSSSTTTFPPRRPKREFTGTRHARYFRNHGQPNGTRSGTSIEAGQGRGAGGIRPRSLFTTLQDASRQEYNGHRENSFQAGPPFSHHGSKHYNADLSSPDWERIQNNAVSAASATVVGGTTVYAPSPLYGAGEAHNGGGFDNYGVMSKAAVMYSGHGCNDGPMHPKIAWNCRGEAVDESCMGALVTTDGFIIVRLNHDIRVDMTTDRAIRIQNNMAGIIMSLNASGSSAAVIHPSGRVYQYGSRVEITTTDANRNSKYAKMWHKGVSFSSEACALVYLVDTAGTRTTTDSFSDMSGDFSVPIFLGESKYGPDMIPEAMSYLQNLQYWVSEDGIENWVINGVRVSQTSDGMVRVGRTSSKHNMRTSPFNGTASMSTPYVHCTASVGNACHLFVKRGERRMHFDGQSFIVRNAGHSAGFDDNHKLKVY